MTDPGEIADRAGVVVVGEAHRASIYRKLSLRTVAELSRLVAGTKGMPIGQGRGFTRLRDRAKIGNLISRSTWDISIIPFSTLLAIIRENYVDREAFRRPCGEILGRVVVG